MKRLLIAVLLFVSILTVVSCGVSGGIDLGTKISSKPGTGLAIRCKFGRDKFKRGDRIEFKVGYGFTSEYNRDISLEEKDEFWFTIDAEDFFILDNKDKEYLRKYKKSIVDYSKIEYVCDSSNGTGVYYAPKFYDLYTLILNTNDASGEGELLLRIHRGKSDEDDTSQNIIVYYSFTAEDIVFSEKPLQSEQKESEQAR